MTHDDAAPDSVTPDRTTPDHAETWERRYAAADRVWSGRVNPVLAYAAERLTPGRALDLGCGEGGDVVWLASRGWRAVGVDLAPTAVARATDAARAAGLDEQSARFVVADLLDPGWTYAVDPAGEGFDLVHASFLQSPGAAPREVVLRRAAGLVVPGGHLLVVTHAAAPPWVEHTGEHDERRFRSANDELEALALPPAEWDTVVVEQRERPATSPDGEETTLEDAVLLLRRR